MPVYRDRAKRRWRFTFNRVVRGARHRATKLLPAGWSRDRAQAYEQAETARLYAVASGLEKPRLSLAGAVQLYVDHRVPELRDHKNIARELAQLVDEIERTPLEDAPELARTYAASERPNLAAATIRNRLSYLKAAVRYAWRVHGYGDRNHAERIVLPTVHNERQVFLRVPAVKQLLAAFDDREAASLFRIAFYSGLRWRAEILPRTPEDLRRLGRDLWLYVGMTKNGSPRMVPVHPAIRHDLRRLPFKRPWHVYADAFQRARKKAGVPHVRPHDLRHSLASEIVSRGGTLADVQAALHHTSVQASKRYAHLYPERVRRVLFGVGKRQKSAHHDRGRRTRQAA